MARVNLEHQTPLDKIESAERLLQQAVDTQLAAVHQNAINAGAAQQPDDSAAIEGQVTKLNQLTAALKAPLTAVVPTPAPTPAPTPTPVSPPPVTPAP